MWVLRSQAGGWGPVGSGVVDSGRVVDVVAAVVVAGSWGLIAGLRWGRREGLAQGEEWGRLETTVEVAKVLARRPTVARWCRTHRVPLAVGSTGHEAAASECEVVDLVERSPGRAGPGRPSGSGVVGDDVVPGDRHVPPGDARFR
jgi:hypothetical protein